MTIGIYEALKEVISTIPLERTADDTSHCACGLTLLRSSSQHLVSAVIVSHYCEEQNADSLSKLTKS